MPSLSSPMTPILMEPWASIPWEVKIYNSTTAATSTSLYHKSSVPYSRTPNALQNLLIWIPAPPKADEAEVPPPSTIPILSSEAGTPIWVIYIHGGAWRDPLVTSSSFTSTVKSLATDHSGIFTTAGCSSSNTAAGKSYIAGLASINYSLSPKTSADAENDTSRRAKHPDHILDVLTALQFLQAKFGFGENYVLLGHSCGATLALQVAMGGKKKWEGGLSPVNPSSSLSPNSNLPVGGEDVQKPIAIVGLNGLYDMPGLIRAPGVKHQALQALYEDFTRRAFGDDEAVWKDISPALVEDWAAGEWVSEGKGKIRGLVLVQSQEDSLVPYWQLERMRDSFWGGGASAALEVRELEAGGDHNDLWKDGARLAEIVVNVVQNLK